MTIILSKKIFLRLKDQGVEFLEPSVCEGEGQSCANRTSSYISYK